MFFYLISCFTTDINQARCISLLLLDLIRIMSLPTIQQLLPKLSALSDACQTLPKAGERGGEQGD